MPVATRRELLEAGIHFGHQTRRWNPKMRRYIFGERSGIYIIDLEKTLAGLGETYEFLLDIARRGGSVLFVGTKKQAQETLAQHAGRVGMPYVNTRWLGGMLTNFQTIHGRLKRMRELREMERSGAFEYLPKKEVLKLRHEKEKLERNLAGIQDMERLPDAVFVIDTKREQIAVKEARKLGIPVVAIVDTNCDPDEVDYVIPGNDDAIRSCALITKIVADALQEGQYLAYQGMAQRTYEPEFEQEPAVASAEEAEADGARSRVQLSEEERAFLGSADEDEATAAAAATDPSPEDALRASAGTEETQVSDGWAAPLDAGDVEAPTVPNEAGAVDAELIEAELDHIAEPSDAPSVDEPVIAGDTTDATDAGGSLVTGEPTAALETSVPEAAAATPAAGTEPETPRAETAADRGAETTGSEATDTSDRGEGNDTQAAGSDREAAQETGEGTA